VKSQYASDGLIQTMGSIKVCDNADPNYGQRYPPNGNNASKASCDSNTANGGNGHNVVHIPIPTTCDSGMSPSLFVYPFDFYWSGIYTYPGITVQTTKDSTNGWWSVAVAESGVQVNKSGSLNFTSIYLAYFTVCSPNGDANKWDPSWFIGDNKLANT
jgi:hypothetical protein